MPVQTVTKLVCIFAVLTIKLSSSQTVEFNESQEGVEVDKARQRAIPHKAFAYYYSTTNVPFPSG